MRLLTSRRHRGWLLLTLTAVGVAATGGLAREAWRATERHQAAAEAALRDHANFAALTFRQQFISRAWLAADGIFREVGHGRVTPAGAPLPPVRLLREAAERIERCGECGPVLRPAYFFRIALTDTALELDGLLPAARRAGLLHQAVHLPLRGEWREWDFASFVDSLAPTPELVYLTERRDPDGRPLALYGFGIGLEAAATALLRPPLEGFMLLPVPPGTSLTNDSLLSVSIHRPDGRPALQLSPRLHADSYAATIHGSRFLGGWSLRVALDPGAAPALLVGGLPRARTPLLGALVLGAALLILVIMAVAWRALELANLRAEFVASVSHELRTPLAQILLFGESLTLGTMRSRRDVRVAGGIIVGEARRLLQLVDNVLLFGREARQGEDAIRPEPLAPLLRDVAAGFAPVAAAADARLATVRMEEVVAPADGAAIRQVLLNLLDNAVKYGPRGQTVSLGLALADGRARLWVEDEGPGIPPGDRARVWRPFVRLARDVDRQAAGSGIGLSLVHEIVARHHGAARIESTPAGGTRVVVELPDARPMAAEVTCAS